MKKIIALKFAFLCVVSMFLVACGGHDFEGAYQVKATGMAATAYGGAIPKVDIGSDYLHFEGQPPKTGLIFEEINKGSEQWLKVSSKNSNDTEVVHLKIIDDDTLEINLGVGKLIYSRI